MTGHAAKLASRVYALKDDRFGVMNGHQIKPNAAQI
jgi:hypothetical protein